MATTDVSIKDVIRTLDHAYSRSEALLDLMRALQRAFATGDDEDVAELKESLTNVIIMRTRLNERQAGLTELLDKASKTQAIGSVAVPEETAEKLGLA